VLRKTPPADFAARLASSSVEELIAVFGRVRVDARGGPTESTAIGFVDCPEGVIRWLVGQGLDVDAADSSDATPLHTRAARGRPEQIPLLLSLGADIERRRRLGGTPLHAAAGNHHPAAVRMLLEHGADPAAVDDNGLTPLEVALKRTANATTARTAEVARLLRDTGRPITAAMRAEVTRIGTDFEFHRARFSPDLLAATEAGLAELYRLFGVPPVPARHEYDGVSPIVVPEGRWQQQYQALWDLLVPSSGPAATVQGEVIRIAGRLGHEILDNGGVNRDADFSRMLDAFVVHVGTGMPLDAEGLAEVRAIASAVRNGADDEARLARMTELAVAWVGRNPAPIPLTDVDYRR
jgi:hypothetical protein